MIAERQENKAVQLNGRDWLSPEVDDIARQAIRDMVPQRSEDGNGLHSQEELNNALSISSFRRNGLLGMLHIKFDGDIEQALRFAYPEIFRKPLLHLDEPHYGDPFQETWREREREIEGRIISTMERSRLGHIYFYDNEVIDSDQKARKLMKLGRRVERHVNRRNTRERHHEKIDVDEWQGRENEDFQRAIVRFLKLGDSVAGFLGSNDTEIPRSILNRIGQQGVFYMIGRRNYPYNELAGSFPNANNRGIEDELLARALELGESLILNNYDQEQIKKTLNGHKIYPVVYRPPNLPEEISRHSLNAFIVSDRVREILEEFREDFLWAIDSALKQGGYLIFRENARQQTNIEYYGQDLWSSRYQRVGTGTKSAQLMIFRKVATGNSMVSISQTVSESSQSTENEEEFGVCTIEHKWEFENGEGADKQIYAALKHVIEQKHRLNGEVTEAQQIDELLKGTLSVSWFRKTGLLPILFSRFGGSVEKAAEFVIEHNQAGRTPPTIIQRSPEGAKSSYNLYDLAKELGVRIDVIRKTLNNAGIKGVQSQRNKGNFHPQTSRMQFSYQEFLTLRDVLRRDLNVEKATKERSDNAERI